MLTLFKEDYYLKYNIYFSLSSKKHRVRTVLTKSCHFAGCIVDAYKSRDPGFDPQLGWEFFSSEEFSYEVDISASFVYVISSVDLGEGLSLC